MFPILSRSVTSTTNNAFRAIFKSAWSSSSSLISRSFSQKTAASKDIRAAVADAPATDFKVEKLSLRSPYADELLVKVVATG